ncbi:DEAD/DEAH box helicase [Myroides odoratimimus]|uniref:DEAD/DEAH box helicase n=1 Tax=Myroides odoratimimus TaxID=76832 RepID=UPI0026DF8ACC|nr:DEAD/DEAH box helicase [Myroides odoratimimus]MDO5858622.1 DEAD/DEAH box helicase [Myroides odoratimimus]
MASQLRIYQHHIVNKVFTNLRHLNSLLIQMPTGTGKTTVFSAIVKKQITEFAPNKRVLIIVHRKELVEQIYTRLRIFGIRAGIIMANEIYEPDRQVQIASLQTLIRKKDLPKNISLIIVDEAHHILSKSYVTLINNYQQSKLLGFTATPTRLSGEGFDKIFQKLIQSKSIGWFIENQFLSPYKHLSLKDNDLYNLKINNLTKDYDEVSLSNFMQTDKKLADILLAYEKYSRERKCIIFCVDVKHMLTLTEKFKNHNISCSYIDSNTKKEEREQILQDFRENRIDVLFNVNIFTEGFDCPDIETVILARPTKSLVLYIQQVGRVLRYKEDNYALIIDCANLFYEHGSILSDFNWSLKGSKELNKELDRNNTLTLTVKENNTNTPKEIRFLELQTADSFLIAPSSEYLLKVLPKIINRDKTKYQSIYDFGISDIEEIIKYLNVKISDKILLSLNEKKILKKRAVETYKEKFSKQKIKLKANIEDKKSSSLKLRKNLYRSEVEEIKEEMKLVFDNLLISKE